MLINADIVSWANAYDGPLFHAVLCDAPYEMEFMGKSWDNSGVAFDPATWRAIARVLHPGAFLFVFAGTLNDDLISVAMRQAGLRKYHRSAAWAYGSGFPKAARIDTVIDERAFQVWLDEHPQYRAEINVLRQQVRDHIKREGYRDRELETHLRDRILELKKQSGLFRVVDSRKQTGAKFKLTQELIDNGGFNDPDRASFDVTAPATDLARTWAGHRYGGQMLKPALESLLIFQKPYTGDAVSSITATGAGALWIDGGRIATDEVWQGQPTSGAEGVAFSATLNNRTSDSHPAGRWPANLVLTHHPLCQPRGVRTVKGHAGEADYTLTGNQGPTSFVTNVKTGAHYGNETIPDWACHPDCAVRRLGEQSGESESKVAPRGGTSPNPMSWYKERSDGEKVAGHTDQGTASRFFFNADFMLERLESAAIFDDNNCVICGHSKPKRDIMNEKQYITEALCDPVTSAGSCSSQPSEHGGSVQTSVPDMQKHANEGKQESRSTVAPSAKSNSRSLQETTLFTAPERARDSQTDWIVQFAKSVVSLCDSCGTAIAQSLVAMLQGNDPAVLPGLASIPGHKRKILLHSLALFAESRASTDIILTTTDLNTFFGFVALAIENNTPVTDQSAPLVFYSSKASRSEREAGLDPRQIRLLRSWCGVEVDDIATKTDGHTVYGDMQGTPEHGSNMGSRRTDFPESTINDGRATPIDNPYQRGETTRRNTHATVKPLSLNRHLATLLLPPDAYAPRRLLVPFAGVASEMIGALLAGWDEVVGVELEADHVAIGNARIAYWQQRRWELMNPDRKITVTTAPTMNGQKDMFDEEL